MLNNVINQCYIQIQLTNHGAGPNFTMTFSVGPSGIPEGLTLH